MMKISGKLVGLALVVVVVLSSCSITKQHKTMKEPTANVEFNKNDFTFSGQVTGEAVATTYFWGLYTKDKDQFNNTGEIVLDVSAGFSLAAIPILGAAIAVDVVEQAALFNMMQNNPDYDVVFYPSFSYKYESRFGGLIEVKTVTAKARLAKIK